jgi:phosphatidylglycerophosphate synthase
VIDRRLRGGKERLLGPVAGAVPAFLSPAALTVSGLGLTLAAAAAAAAGHPAWAVAGWLAGRLLDGLDGEVARSRGTSSDWGGYLDMVSDTVGYAALPLGVALGRDDAETWATVAILLASFYVNAVSWAYAAAVLEKRGSGAASTGERTSVTMPSGLIEGAETVVFFTAFAALPGLAPALFTTMAALVALTIALRMRWVHAALAGGLR